VSKIKDHPPVVDDTKNSVIRKPLKERRGISGVLGSLRSLKRGTWTDGVSSLERFDASYHPFFPAFKIIGTSGNERGKSQQCS